jgi:hypothetical protein
VTLLATRRAADDLQTMLDGGRPRSPRAADELGPLVTLASALRPMPQQPRPEFRAALREQLLAEATRPAPTPVSPPAAPRQRRSASWRLRQVTATIAVAAVVAGAGAAAASTRALPGDSLYGLKRQIEQVQLSLARGDMARGTELLDQADARLSEAEALAAAQRGPDTDKLVGRALTDLDVAFSRATDELTAAYRDSGDDEPLVELDRFVAEHQERLNDLMQLLDPSLRAQVRDLAQRLAAVGAEVAALLARPGQVSAAALATPEDGRAVGREINAVRRATGVKVGGATAGGDPAGATESAVSGLLQSLGGTTSAATGDGSSGGSSGDTSGGLLGDLTGQTGSTSGGVLPTEPTPLSTSVLPSPISTILPSDPVGAVTSTVPLPVSSACVPLPPLTTCP